MVIENIPFLIRYKSPAGYHTGEGTKIGLTSLRISADNDKDFPFSTMDNRGLLETLFPSLRFLGVHPLLHPFWQRLIQTSKTLPSSLHLFIRFCLWRCGGGCHGHRNTAHTGKDLWRSRFVSPRGRDRGSFRYRSFFTHSPRNLRIQMFRGSRRFLDSFCCTSETKILYQRGMNGFGRNARRWNCL